jgi:hypothetical protein
MSSATGTPSGAPTLCRTSGTTASALVQAHGSRHQDRVGEAGPVVGPEPGSRAPLPGPVRRALAALIGAL